VKREEIFSRFTHQTPQAKDPATVSYRHLRVSLFRHDQHHGVWVRQHWRRERKEILRSQWRRRLPQISLTF
jgi:hypothetical protein